MEVIRLLERRALGFIYQNPLKLVLSFPACLSYNHNHLFHLPKQKEHPVDRSLASLTVSKPPSWAAQDKPMDKPLIARKLGRSQQKKPATSTVSPTSFLQMRIPCHNSLSFIPNIRYVLWSLGISNYEQTSADTLLHTIADFERYTQEANAQIAAGSPF